jgi:uncharacterized membrane protein (UPF0127 family)
MFAPMRSLSLLALIVAACGGGGGTTGPTVVIDTAADEQVIRVEVADDAEERARGLMGRRELAEDAGMVFVFPEPTRGAFWMRDTLIPLSIAFYDGSGTILRILDMEPCRAEPCPLYDPGVAYRGALEVNQGAFERWGVLPGDTLTLRE